VINFYSFRHCMWHLCCSVFAFRRRGGTFLQLNFYGQGRGKCLLVVSVCCQLLDYYFPLVETKRKAGGIFRGGRFTMRPRRKGKRAPLGYKIKCNATSHLQRHSNRWCIAVIFNYAPATLSPHKHIWYMAVSVRCITHPWVGIFAYDVTTLLGWHLRLPGHH